MTLEQRLRELAPRAPGVVVAIVDASGVREEVATGFADLARDVRATPATPWLWFSMTKVVTVTAAMRMIERGELDLDEPVSKHVPAVARLEPSSWAARITVRHLMTHASGIKNPIPLTWVRPAAEPAIDVEALAETRLRANQRLRFEPGKKSKYSNLGALVLGAAMQHASKTPFAALVTREVLEPVGMSRTWFELPRDAAVGYHPRWNPMRLLVPRWVVGDSIGRWVSTRPFLVDGAPYGGLVGPIEDAARFVRMHLRNGELDGVRVLAEKSALAMRERGLGWFRHFKARRGDPPSVEHGGNGPGFFDVMRIYPTLGIGVIVMGNATKYDIDAIARLALT